MRKRELIRVIEKAAREGAESLGLSYKRITQLPKQIGQLVNLQTLDLHNNHLSTLPEQIGQLASLQSLYLDGNQLERLPRSIGKLKKLTALDLGDRHAEGGNPLVELPVEIP